MREHGRLLLVRHPPPLARRAPATTVPALRWPGHLRSRGEQALAELLLEDCCGATDAGNHTAALKMVKMQNGVFGAVSSSKAMLEAIR